MAVGIVLDFEGATLDQYDQVVKKMGIGNGNLPPGGVFHWVTKTDKGFRVTDVWDSQAQFEKFAEESIGPLTAEVGITNPPTVTFYEVYNSLTK